MKKKMKKKCIFWHASELSIFEERESCIKGRIKITQCVRILVEDVRQTSAA